MAVLRKGDITGRVAAELGTSRVQGENALNAVLKVIQDARVLHAHVQGDDEARESVAHVRKDLSRRDSNPRPLRNWSLDSRAARGP